MYRISCNIYVCTPTHVLIVLYLESCTSLPHFVDIYIYSLHTPLFPLPSCCHLKNVYTVHPPFQMDDHGDGFCGVSML